MLQESLMQKQRCYTSNFRKIDTKNTDYVAICADLSIYLSAPTLFIYLSAPTLSIYLRRFYLFAPILSIYLYRFYLSICADSIYLSAPILSICADSIYLSAPILSIYLRRFYLSICDSLKILERLLWTLNLVQFIEKPSTLHIRCS